MAVFFGGKDRDDRFVGTEASDRFVFDPVDLTAGDTIIGGGGVGLDVLRFSRAGTISAEALAGVSGIERIELAATGASSIILTQAIVDSSSTGAFAVVGGTGADRIDASAVSGGVSVPILDLLGGEGDDTLIGGLGQRFLLDGGAGRDTLQVGDNTAVYDADDVAITGAGHATLRISGGETVDLSASGNQVAGGAALVTGFAAVDASASTAAVRLTGVSNVISTLIGGSGADTLIGATYITGGRGADTMVGALDPYDPTFFRIGQGDFARGESITGDGMQDMLELTGSADFRKGTLVGMEAIRISAGAEAVTRVVLTDHQVAHLGGLSARSTLPGHDIVVDIYLTDTHEYQGRRFEGDVTLHGTAGADVLTIFDSALLGGGGDDVLSTLGAISGDGGDDIVTTRSFGIARVIDGGSGVDTLVVEDGGSGSMKFNLSATSDQLTNQAAVVRGFENLDLSRVHEAGSAANIVGSAGANHIVGTRGDDVIRGGAGDDVLIGGDVGGADTLYGEDGDDLLSAEGGRLSGGAGADTFRFDGLGIPVTITDFSRADTLEFRSEGFGVAGGVFDTRAVARTARADLSDADLVILTTTVNDAFDIMDFVRQSHTLSDDNGVFFAGVNSKGHTLLFYSEVASSSSSGFIHSVADLGVLGKATNLVLSDFHFI